ncbi:aldehyde dehydrogenase family protein [Membranihabitans maritimus]|uniref:aldehyde dehydrogenase family protein n=1 Tax=Membranihabitans maritimus TaxID=2904244 RepID=UPI001F3FE52D|nr:aldehyde dehydrogenase family protein [Membranihabitans maritimus]
MSEANSDKEVTQLFEIQKENAEAVKRTSAKERKLKLKRLYNAILAHREPLHDALWKDLRKPGTETDITEIHPTLVEFRFAMRNLKNWMKIKSVKTPILLLGAKSQIQYEPKGCCLIMSPWNYPFQLSFAPLISAISAGNTVILKPSEFAENTSRIIKEIIEGCFGPEEVAVVEGGVDVATQLLRQKFDHIFFTGSPEVGRIVMAEAAKNLTGVTLELGGKSPAIVDETAVIEKSAGRIAWAKFINAGQTCIAPDYVLVHETRRSEFLLGLRKAIEDSYGEEQNKSTDYVRIINEKHFRRIKSYVDSCIMQGGNIVYGGKFDEETRYIQPTIICDLPIDGNLMKNEIFGPVLPVLFYNSNEEAVNIIRCFPKPLALYIYSKDKRNTDYFLRNTTSGGVCINTSAIHAGNPYLPFGGVNESGIGKSRGFYGFKEFSNERGIMKQRRQSVIEWIRPPYTKEKQKMLDWLIERL